MNRPCFKTKSALEYVMKKAEVICIAVIMLVLSHAGYAVVTKQSGMSHNFLFNISDFGARGDGKTICTTAIQATIDSCSKSGGGTVLVPPGVYVTAPL
jgi:hypothetical protein